jgi:nitroreductase
MEFEKLVRERRSIRRFKSKQIDKQTLKRLLDAIILAPSAGDLQAYKICVVTNPQTKRRLAEAAWGQDFIAQAPLVLVFLQDKKASAIRYGKRGELLYSLQDATIACTFAHLMATNIGLGSCWVGAYDDAKVTSIIKGSKDLFPIAILPIGYPAESPFPTPRLPIEDLVYSEEVPCRFKM